MHLRPEGVAAYARLLSQAFEWPLPRLEMSLSRVATPEAPERLRA
jgi:hypothetical protein